MSEVINESNIEATDSLNPYMITKGIDYMIENCSMTARIGARQWYKDFKNIVDNNGLYSINNNNKFNEYSNTNIENHFINHPIHESFDIIKNVI